MGFSTFVQGASKALGKGFLWVAGNKFIRLSFITTIFFIALIGSAIMESVQKDDPKIFFERLGENIADPDRKIFEKTIEYRESIGTENEIKPLTYVFSVAGNLWFIFLWITLIAAVLKFGIGEASLSAFWAYLLAIIGTLALQMIYHGIVVGGFHFPLIGIIEFFKSSGLWIQAVIDWITNSKLARWLAK